MSESDNLQFNLLNSMIGFEKSNQVYMGRRGDKLGHLTGVEDDFYYSELTVIPEDMLRNYCSRIKSSFRSQVGAPSAREEWMVRTHVAVKLILSATVMMTSAQFALRKQLRIVEPYLLYYSLFNTSRALVLLVPDERWREGAILDETTHTKAMNVTADRLRLVSRDISDQYISVASRALTAREFFSYKFPAQGTKGHADLLPSFDDVLALCRFVAELTQLNSQCLECVFADHGTPYGEFEEAPLQRFFEYANRFGEIEFHDEDDYYRLGSLLRRLGRPVSLAHTATDGLVEDFFAAWAFDGEGSDDYSPRPWDLIISF